MLILVLKTLHVLGAVLFLGVGLGSAWAKFQADRSGDPVVIAWCQRHIVLADWIFTTPSAILLPVTGLWMVELYALPWTTPWVMWGIGGYLVSGVLWLPAVYLQLKMKAMAETAVETSQPLPEAFHKYRRIWTALGFPAFLIALSIVWVMVAKWAYAGPWS